MKLSANHHFVPRMILKRFCFSGESIYFHDKASKERKVHHRNIGSIFKRRHLYTYQREDGTRDDSLERFYSTEIESQIGHLIDRIIIAFNSPRLTISDEDWRLIFRYVYHRMKRAPDFLDYAKLHERMHELYAGAVSDMLASGETDIPSIETAFPGNDFEVAVKNLGIEILGIESSNVLNVLSSYNIGFGTPSRSKNSFTIGSNPMAQFSPSGAFDLRERACEIWMPLHPKVVVCLYPWEASANLVQLSTSQVRSINESVFAKSRLTASPSSELLISLST